MDDTISTATSPIVKNPDGTVTVTLTYAIKVEGVPVTALTFARPKVKHLMSLDGYDGGVAKSAALIGVLSVIPPSSVEQIDAADFSVIAGVIADFLPDFLAGAKKSEKRPPS